ncbi:MAG: cobyric acid synthase [Desulfarculaceae bacterium]|jgi:adenosylcobyric acid synthase
MPLQTDPKYRPIMVVGTGSHVGKSVLVMGLCRLFRRQGINVAPFKAQNMALNSGITPQGLEMGRAQISQAEAAGVEPHVDMNPILLKPTSQVGSQVVLMGKPIGNYKGRDYFNLKPKLVKTVTSAFGRLQQRHQLLVLEGAGSCAEMNLKKQDLVNMAMAKRAAAKVILAADIDTGGVFAQIIGSLSLLTPSERRLVHGVVINKFRGDPGLFQDGIAFLEKRTKKKVLGLVPHFSHISLPQEDGVALERGELKDQTGGVRVGIVRLSHISNYTDGDALAAHPGVGLSWIDQPTQLAGLDLLILPGTKNTLAALAALRQSGLFEAIKEFHRLGGKILGLCGGYQLLGRTIADPQGVEGPPAREAGLGLLPVDTEMAGDKTTTRATAKCLPGLPFAAPDPISGYEIHMGMTSPAGQDRPAFRLIKRLDQTVDLKEGQISPDRRVIGTYLHGLLDNNQLRGSLLNWAAGKGSLSQPFDYADFKSKQYDLLADHLQKYINLEGILEKMP